MNEKFEEKSDPIEDMEIGVVQHLKNGIKKLQRELGVGTIRKEDFSDYIKLDSNESDGFIFNTDNDAINYLIRKYIYGISENELSRFLAFDIENIY